MGILDWLKPGRRSEKDRERLIDDLNKFVNLKDAEELNSLADAIEESRYGPGTSLSELRNNLPSLFRAEEELKRTSPLKDGRRRPDEEEERLRRRGRGGRERGW